MGNYMGIVTHIWADWGNFCPYMPIYGQPCGPGRFHHFLCVCPALGPALFSKISARFSKSGAGAIAVCLCFPVPSPSPA